MKVRTVYDEAALIALLRAWASEHGRPPSARDFTGHQPSTATFVRRFRSWTGALKAAGLTPPPNTWRTRKARCLAAFHAYAADTTAPLSVSGYRAWARSAPARPSLATLYRYWGSWNHLLAKLPTDSVTPPPAAIPDRLLADLRRCAEALNHWPTSPEYDTWVHQMRLAQPTGARALRLSRTLRRYGYWKALIHLAGGPAYTPHRPASLPPRDDLLEALSVWQRTTNWRLFPQVSEWPAGRRAVPGLPAWRVYRQAFGSWEALFVAYDAWRYRDSDASYPQQGGRRFWPKKR